MTTTELLALFREEVQDLAAPYLWSDSLIYGYINDAQKQFCRNTWGIEDARGFKVNVVAGSEWYTISPRILRIRAAVDSAGKDVPVIAVEAMEANGMRFDGRLGAIRALVKGLEKNTLRAWPVPNASAVVQLFTFRLSDDVGAGDDLEIGEQHHRHLVSWVKHLAYDNQDAETNDKAASERNGAKFEANCAAAKTEQGRLRRPRAVVAYGGV